MKKQEDGPARGTWHIYSRGIEERLSNRLFITGKFLYHLEHLSKPAWKGRPPAQRQCPQALQREGKNDHVKVKCPCSCSRQLVTAMPHCSTRVLVVPSQGCRAPKETQEMKDEQPHMSKWPWLIPSPDQGNLSSHNAICTSSDQ